MSDLFLKKIFENKEYGHYTVFIIRQNYCSGFHIVQEMVKELRKHLVLKDEKISVTVYSESPYTKKIGVETIIKKSDISSDTVEKLFQEYEKCIYLPGSFNLGV